MKKLILLLLLFGLLLIWSAPSGAVPFKVGTTQTLLDAGYETPWAMKDQQTQVETVIDLWNADLTNDPLPLPEPIDLTPGDEYDEMGGTSLDELDLKEGTYIIPEGITYVSFKYDGQNEGAGFELWYVEGDAGSSINFGPWRYALSHYDEWGGGAPVPEPATMLLLGTGLLGLAGFGRKKLKK